MFSHAKTKDDFAREVRRLIMSGSLRFGQKLPSLRELEMQTGLSRQTISICLQSIAGEGILKNESRRGYFASYRQRTPDSHLHMLMLPEGYGNDEGGVARSATRIARELARTCKVTVFTFDRNKVPGEKDWVGLDEEFCEENLAVWRFGASLKTRDRDVFDRMSEKFRATILRRLFESMLSHPAVGDINLVFSMYLINSSLIGQHLANALGVRHVAGIRGNDLSLGLFRDNRFGYLHWLAAVADAIVPVNEYLERLFTRSFQFAIPRVHKIPNAFPAIAFQDVDTTAARQKVLGITGWNDADIIMCFPGRFREKKGIVEGLEMLDTASRERLPVRLLIIGEIPRLEAKLFSSQIKALESRNTLRITGLQDHATVLGLMPGCDAIFMPSRSDGMANGVLEGMACGLPPIVSDIFRDVVDDECGFIGRSNEDFLAIMRSLTRDNCSLKGQKARERARLRQSHDEAADYLELFKTVLAAEHRPEHCAVM